jgi:hypothetical protein
MTEDEIKKKIGEYLDIFQPEERDTLSGIADFLGLEAETVKWSVAISTLGTGTLIYGLIDATRELSNSVFSRGGLINEVNRHIYTSLANLSLDTSLIDNHDSFFEQIQNYIDDTYVPGDTGLFDILYKIDITDYVDNEVLITEDNLNKSIFAVEYFIESYRSNKNFFKPDEITIFKNFLSEAINAKDGSKFGAKFGRPVTNILANQYSLTDIGVLIADLVADKIDNLEPIQIEINKVESGGALNLFTLTSEPVDARIVWKIEQNDLYPEQTGVNFVGAGDPGRPDTPLGKITKSITQWPIDATGGNAQLEAAIVQNNGLRDNKDIRTYAFNYWTAFETSWVEDLGRWWLEEPSTPQEYMVSLIDNRYIEFILQILNDYNSDDTLDETVGNTFQNVFVDGFFIEKVYELVAIDKEIARRLQIFKELEKLSDEDVPEGALTPEQEFEIAKAGLKAFAASDVEEGRRPLTDEQIESRQKFYKQCALMLNIGRLSTKFDDVLLDRQTVYEKFDGPLKSKPFGGRFWRAKSSNTEQLITNLVSSKDSSYMFEIPTHIMTQLTPKFRLYKVMNEQDGTLKQTEFIFPMYADINRSKNFKKQQNTTQESTIPTFLEAQFDKGDGVGLKSFSLDFNGTNPAEARNDVKGQMSLFFQSFADFTRTRIDPNNNEYRFVDLIIQPKPDKNNRVDGIKLVSLKQYEPTFYRIRVDMGYNIPQAGDLQGIDEFTKDKNGKTELDRLQNALRSMNKSFYLCMIDHSFNIKNDGSVEMNFTYRAYLETALKSLRFDALTTPELAKKRIENQTKLYDVAARKQCTASELRELQLAIAGVEEEMILNSLNSIMERMYKRNKIFTTIINNEDRKYFLKNGFYRNCELMNGVSLDDNPDSSTDGDLGIVLNSTFLSETPDENFERDANDTSIQFFFFGDLLHTILDALYDPDTKDKIVVGMENTKIVLGHFEFDPYQSDELSGKYNISNIPISVDFFGEWFKQNVLNQKSTRRTFPILNFIRNLSNYLVNNALLEACVNRNVEKSLRFQTGQISALTRDGIDPLGSLVENNRFKSVIHTDLMRDNGSLPLKGDVEGNPNVKNFYHYIVLSCNGSALTYAGTGKYEEDIKKGRFHVEIGSNRGIVKTVQFAKTDMQYLREARFFRNGTDGLLQLSSVYTATVEMFGNTLFYPGMDLWINPYGFGGTHLGRPSQGGGESKSISNRSLANILGIGGYHTITGVSTTLTPQGFNTSIKSQHYYSGDGENPDTTTLKAAEDSSEDELIEMGVLEDSRDAEAAANCSREILDQINFYNTEEDFGESIESPVDVPSSSTYPTSPVEIEVEIESSVYVEGEGNYVVGGVERFGRFELDGEDMYFYYFDESGFEQEVLAV